MEVNAIDHLNKFCNFFINYGVQYFIIVDSELICSYNCELSCLLGPNQGQVQQGEVYHRRWMLKIVGRGEGGVACHKVDGCDCEKY